MGSPSFVILLSSLPRSMMEPMQTGQEEGREENSEKREKGQCGWKLKQAAQGLGSASPRLQALDQALWNFHPIHSPWAGGRKNGRWEEERGSGKRRGGTEKQEGQAKPGRSRGSPHSLFRSGLIAALVGARFLLVSL